MRRIFMVVLVAALVLVLPGCTNTKIEVTGDVLAFAFTGRKPPFGSSTCYLSFFDAESNIQQNIELGPHYAASVTYVDPYIFIPMYMNIKGIQDITEWVYYINIHDGKQGRFQVAWQPMKIMPYNDYYVVLSAMHGSDTCVQLFDRNFELLQEKTVSGSLNKDSFILGDNLFASVGGGVYCFSLDAGLTPERIVLSHLEGGISVTEWNGKVVITDRATVWLVDAESLKAKRLDDFPAKQGPGVSLVVGDWLMVGDTYSENAIVYDLTTGETRHLSFKGLISHLSLIDDYVIVSHNRGKAFVDSNWGIIEVQSVLYTGGITNFVQVTLP